MPPFLYDAHIHLADPALERYREQIEADYEAIGLKQAVVNGTCPQDWPHVLALAQRDLRHIPAIGLHPWKVNHAPADWQAEFLKALDTGAQAIGEIGLDKWIEGHDIDRQQAAFQWQLAHATERNLPVSIHCLKAIGPLMDTLRTVPLPQRGSHLHAYNGPVELIPELVQLGAYFSFNAGQLKAGSSKVTARIQAVPDDRLLIETDAPDMLPPAEHRSFELPDSSLTHPATLIDGYSTVAEIRTTSLEKLVEQVANNFETYFLK
ncbi:MULTISPECIES: TatD family hydrolase [unclassified Lentimonas]|uniref:TatD family hydrolase n=1 Tax=unclassified Lentimonas TaxID=2630993 RepID=UPI001325C528|nr:MULTISPECIES: TatD family hydrolase [unclassified Lentimonas]CAA6676817.1 Putative deoxyribonuclease YjjV [Lentimonas sp. CC4]CAA6686624.1 Putative deoxyribonuclease YjjV [Lentimonas sp. CC6]CAA7075799.1 Putative deoxyribonuclease YjjV [Lentimonas sp. CC4]CAA7168037.1 Putative deoxyribonuclease YjjV [Lentimonas sp. CC21]CAA7183018.1 Putative deoxyribonuclease YjjV [Lentimonas sp. CC8]